MPGHVKPLASTAGTRDVAIDVARGIAIILVVVAVTSAVYDEVQLQHKRDQLNNLFNGN